MSKLRTILLVDDELSRLEFHIDAIREIAILITATPEEATTILREKCGVIDVILMDIIMCLDGVIETEGSTNGNSTDGGLILLESFPDELTFGKKIVYFTNRPIKTLEEQNGLHKRLIDDLDEGSVHYLEKSHSPKAMRKMLQNIINDL